MATINETVGFQLVLARSYRDDRYWYRHCPESQRGQFIVVECIQRHGAEWWLRVREGDTAKGCKSTIAKSVPMPQRPSEQLLSALTGDWYADVLSVVDNSTATPLLAWHVKAASHEAEAREDARAKHKHGYRKWTKIDEMEALVLLTEDNERHGFKQRMLESAEARFNRQHKTVHV